MRRRKCQGRLQNESKLGQRGCSKTCDKIQKKITCTLIYGTEYIYTIPNYLSKSTLLSEMSPGLPGVCRVVYTKTLLCKCTIYSTSVRQ